MPISEDEIEYGYGSHNPPMHSGGMSKAEQRRSNKPIMEKRRRARINHCLDELKSLILDAMNKDPARHSKLEKADILEMTVKHLQTIQRQQLTLAVSADPTVVHKFRTGFAECSAEVGRYIGRMEGVEPGVKQRLASHLNNCVNGLHQISQYPLPNPSHPQGNPGEDVNNNTASARLQMLSGLQLIPSRLPTGELALLLPNSQHLPFFPSDNQVSTTTESPNATVTSNSIDRSRHSAFTAVGKDKLPSKSPLPSPTSTTASSFGEESCDRPYPSPTHPPEVTSTSEHPRTPLDSNLIDNQKLQKTTDHQNLLRITPSYFSNLREDSQNQNFPRFPTAAIKAIQTPLTVITSDEMLKERPQRFLDSNPLENTYKDPLDFSKKKDSFPVPYSSSLKRPHQEITSDKLLIKSTEYQPPLKVPKVFSDNHYQTNNVIERRSLFEIQNQSSNLQGENPFHIGPNPPLQERVHTTDSHNQPSTSSTEVSRDMWRPW
ncbi:protein hairy-like [Homalodisca vitripennis]|uniref:protein hairy-like n=1 Tax=Homalodisca vitripennis TaxID=197043 RepID=UPI001EEC35AC|nr:protein hairy-like [Homalodisca vitripennis]